MRPAFGDFLVITMSDMPPLNLSLIALLMSCAKFMDLFLFFFVNTLETLQPIDIHYYGRTCRENVLCHMLLNNLTLPGLHLIFMTRCRHV